MLYDSPEDDLTPYEYAKAYGLLEEQNDDFSSYYLEERFQDILEMRWNHRYENCGD